jgi:hypothetical protein
MSEQNKDVRRLVSERGFELVEQGVYDTPVITVENYQKWYNLYVIQPTGEVEILDPGLITEVIGEINEILVIDHTFHPKLLLLLAKKLGAEVPSTTMEMVAGRWVLDNEIVKGIDYHLPEYYES